jgi:hypothetical protein
MSRTSRSLTVLALSALAGSIALAQPTKDTTKPAPKPAAPTQPSTTPAKTTPSQPAGDHKMPAPPPGMTEADMMACAAAAAPGPNHEFLAKRAGTWSGHVKMWMPGTTEPQESECTTVFTSLMDGRFLHSETNGEMPGMGPFHGFGAYGYDNVGKKFQATWFDNCGTGMMTGTGELSSDSKTLNWTMNYNCPLKGGPIVMREVEHITGPNTMTLEMFGPNPKTGKEEKALEISYTRKSAGAATTPTTSAPTAPASKPTK